MLRLYLDTSTIVKRYITEPGTLTTDLVFDRAEGGELIITLSLWNIGEALGVLDERRRRRWLSEEEFTEILKRLADELVKLIRLRVLEVIPIFAPILVEAWGLILDHHIHEADALQLTTCTYSQSDALLSGDESLIKISRELGLKAFHIVKEEEKLKNFIKGH